MLASTIALVLAVLLALSIYVHLARVVQTVSVVSDLLSEAIATQTQERSFD